MKRSSTENQIITNEIADKLKELKLESIRVRIPLTCESPRGVCARCYGVDMSTNQLVEEGLAVGIIARSVDRRAGHAAHDAYVPHRRRRDRSAHRKRHQGDQRRHRPASRHQRGSR